MSFLITGCGRSGSLYIARALRLAGLDVGHECAGKDGAVSGPWLVEDTCYPSYHSQERPQFDQVLLQTREPLGAIASLTTASRVSWVWNARHVPIHPDDPPLRTASLYWLYWNRKALAKCDYHYRIEELERCWPDLQQRLGFSLPYSALNLSTQVNHREHPQYSWADIVAQLSTSEYFHLVNLRTLLGYK
jgi:hypothetical protein